MTEQIELGDKVKDRITGFCGVVTGRTTYISGCDQILVSPPVKDDGSYVDGHWIDYDRLQVVNVGHVPVSSVSSAERPGPDLPAPVK